MLLLVVFVACLIIGVPILATIGMATLIPMMVRGTFPLTMLTQVLYTGVDKFQLIAVSGFILAGTLMEYAGLTDKILEVSNKAVGNITGGLANITILACMLFAALSGSGPATTAAIGSLAIPAMIKSNYSKGFAGGVTATGGTLGILIPPSNPMIIYAVIANVSVVRMFMAGLIPGIVVTLAIMFVAYLISKKKGFVGTGERFSLVKLLKAIWDGRWALLAPFIILGGIYAGVFTPTEAAEIGVLYALFVGLVVYRTLNVKKIYRALVKASLLTGTIIVIVGVAAAFGRLLAMYQIPQRVAGGIGLLSQNPEVVLLLIAGLLIFIGTWMETLAQIIILTPIFLPVVTALGVDPIHFGVIFVVCCQIGFCTPPLGANLYVVTKLSDVSLESVSWSAVPFVVTLIACVVVLIFFPQISLALPRLLMG